MQWLQRRARENAAAGCGSGGARESASGKGARDANPPAARGLIAEIDGAAYGLACYFFSVSLAWQAGRAKPGTVSGFWR